VAPFSDLAYGRSVSSNFPADILELKVTEYGPDARVVTVVGEIDALTAPDLATFLTAQLTVAQVVVVNLDGVQFLASVGISALFEANKVATREDRARCGWCTTPRAPTWRWRPLGCESTSPWPTT
jgi:anti-anti-sigma factor